MATVFGFSGPMHKQPPHPRSLFQECSDNVSCHSFIISPSDLSDTPVEERCLKGELNTENACEMSHE